MTNTDKWQTRLLVREGAPKRQDSNFGWGGGGGKNLVKSPRLGLTPRHTDWLTVSRNVTLTLTWEWLRRVVKWSRVKWSEKCFLSYSEKNSKVSCQMRNEVQWSESAVKHSFCYWISNKPRKTSDFQTTIGYRYMYVCMRVCSHMPLFLP
jgi:hypothetical protein